MSTLDPTSEPLFLHLDCRHYRGDRPCIYKRLCEGCPHYAPMGPRVLIIKLGALGDVVRTHCLVPTLLAADDPPFITWLTSPAARPLVERMPGVHRVLTFGPDANAALEVERFDRVLSLDKEPGPCAVAMRVQAEEKLGIGLSRYGTPYPLNEHAHYYFRLGLDDPEKFYRNQKSYPELIHEALGMTWRGDPYAICPTEKDRAQAAARLAAAGVEPGRTLVGINPGAGKVFAHKAWREEGYVELIGELARVRPELGVLMLGGPDERDLIGRIMTGAKSVAGGKATVYNPGSDSDLGTFAALVARCAVTVSGDTLAMHLALATGRRSVAIFGPTCPQEIEMFGRGERIVTPIGCAPCYLRACDKSPHCQDMILASQVLEATLRQVEFDQEIMSSGKFIASTPPFS